jgi:hypothetical protein
MDGPVGTEISSISSAFLPKLTSNHVAAAPAKGRYWDFGVTDKMDHADEIGVWIEEDTVSALDTK